MRQSGAPKTARLVAVALSTAFMLGRPTSASARAGGIVTDSCQACHSGGDTAPTLSLSPEPSLFNPGDLVQFTLTVRAPSAKVGGVFITTGGVGALRALVGEGLQINGQGLTHTAPKAAVNGAVTFRFAWQAPVKPGGVDIRVAALAGNGNNAPSGDSPGGGEFQWAVGCPAQTFYVDLDRDGYGAKSLGTLLGCVGDTAPVGFAIADGDCDENNEKIHPGATEICNRQDDNCDGQIDEGSSPVTMWPDQDGDGYYGAQLGVSKIGCGDVPGYAAQAGDCDDTDRAIHPNAVETCNLKDDDCDGDVDEHVRPRCGLGWCARESLSCSPADCQPGPPIAETCNSFDDDCDGEDDNGACPAGNACAGGACVPSAATGGSAGSTGGSAGHPSTGGSPPDPSGMAGGAGTARESGCAMASPRPVDSTPGRREFYTMLVCAGCLALRLRRATKRRK